MAAHRKQDRDERIAVAYVHSLVANAELIWREMTGRDIGIDGVIEVPYSDARRYSEPALRSCRSSGEKMQQVMGL